jgi:hypothetical protein
MHLFYANQRLLYRRKRLTYTYTTPGRSNDRYGSELVISAKKLADYAALLGKK